MQSIVDQDLGTPARVGTPLITLTIDGQPVTVPEGTSVLRAAALLGQKIPKLCATEQLEAFGSCRLCLVQIEGMKGLPASCTTPVAEGMQVTTQTAKLAEVRRGVMELYISDHPLDCLTCPANGHCELQDMAGVVGLREVRYGYAGAVPVIQVAERTADCDCADVAPVDETVRQPLQLGEPASHLVQLTGGPVRPTQALRTHCRFVARQYRRIGNAIGQRLLNQYVPACRSSFRNERTVSQCVEVLANDAAVVQHHTIVGD